MRLHHLNNVNRAIQVLDQQCTVRGVHCDVMMRKFVVARSILCGILIGRIAAHARLSVPPPSVCLSCMALNPKTKRHGKKLCERFPGQE